MLFCQGLMTCVPYMRIVTSTIFRRIIFNMFPLRIKGVMVYLDDFIEDKNPYVSKKLRNFLDRLGCLSLRKAFASI